MTHTTAHAIPVDTGRLLLVDPAHLPADLLHELTHPNPHGITTAALIHVGDDGWYVGDVRRADGDYYGNLDFCLDAAADVIAQLSTLIDLIALETAPDRAVLRGLAGRALTDAEALEGELLELDAA